MSDLSKKSPPEPVSVIDDIDIMELVENAPLFVDQALQYQDLMMMYDCAIKEVRTKLEVLNSEFSVRYQRNPIEFISSRIKKPVSIARKLRKRGFPVNISSMEENLTDIAGVRVICSFIDDIYAIADMLTRQDDLRILERKDYIQAPKPNGYRSLHLILEVPVFFSDHKRSMKAEVQIRTIAMDFWASLEHQLKYKKEVPDEQEIIQELKECADTIAATDQRMMAIRNRIHNTAQSPEDPAAHIQPPQL